MPGGSCAPLRGGRIVEHATHRGGQPSSMPLRITVISSFIDAEHVISESDSRTSHDSTACT
ncbi:Uncharacterised protein [Mycobacterium tuberculosis]|uniref:Uncharacterized protein n=1 Tax=Mycobacterium tuberculosis TaxID=1773 RepID=A0A0U0SAE9_MYCTX|nr:Uncharacterised protein [Mycobacterium tuberculosis]